MTQRKLTTRMLALILALLISEPTWLLAANPAPELPDPGSVAGATKQQQEQLGLQVMAEVYKQMPVLPDSSPETRYIQQLGKKLESVIPAEHNWPYQFHVIPQKEINAFALPGGPLFINVGTITAADNEAQLVGVIAHEMSHIYMQHSMKQASKQSMAQGILGALGSVLGQGALGTVARAGISIGAGTIFLKYSRNDEAQADAVGAIIAYKTGYNPKAMADFFVKLEQQGGGGGPQFLSDHPNPGNRQASIEKEIQNWPPKNYLSDSASFQQVKQDASRIKTYTAQEIADGAKKGTWAQQNKNTGSTPANLPASSGSAAAAGTGDISRVTLEQVKPSGRYIQYQGNGVGIDYPDNWQAAGDANSGITIAPPAGVSQGNIAYGVIINAAQDQNASSLDQAMQNLIQGMQQSNPGLHTKSNPKNISVNGIQGRSVDLASTSPVQRNGQQTAERDWLVTLPRQQGSLLYLVFIAPENDFGKLRSTYQHMLNSLRFQ